MSAQFHVSVVLGTRPEAIKLAPLVKALREQDVADVTCVSTQQHSSLLRDTLDAVDLAVDVEMAAPDRAHLSALTSSVALNLGEQLSSADLVVVQGDTLSAFAGALTAFLSQVPVAHLEAGLRTSNLYLPHPEEGLRRAITDFASLHLAPTQGARGNLEREGVPASDIIVTGNTSIDAILDQLQRADASQSEAMNVKEKYCVLTVHRRETWGQPMHAIARAVWRLAQQYPDIDFICPLHPNPQVRAVFEQLEPLANLRVIDPMPHDTFVAFLAGSQVILSDSGGIQEEATVLGVPVVILRGESERPEVVDSGIGFIAGVQEAHVFEIAQRLLQARLNGSFRVDKSLPFGDGRAGVRGALAIQAFLSGADLPEDMCAVPA